MSGKVYDETNNALQLLV